MCSKTTTKLQCVTCCVVRNYSNTITELSRAVMQRSEVEKLSRAFSRWVEHSDWSFICLQISCLKWENYHVDFNHSVSERFAWIGSPTPTRSLPIFLLLHVLLLTEGMSTALKFLVRNPHTRIGTRKANGHPRVSL